MKLRNMFFLPSDNNSASSHSSTKSSPPTFSRTMMEENIDNAEQIIRKWDLDANITNNVYNSKIPLLFINEGNRKDAQQFLNSITELRTAMHFFVAEDANSDMLVRAHILMQMAMKRLEKEFFTILKTYKASILSPESVSVSVHNSLHSTQSTWSTFSDVEEEDERDDNSSEDSDNNNESGRFEFPSMKASLVASQTEKVSELVMTDIKTIADCMINSGYGKECVHIYKLIRKSIIDETLYNLGVDNLSYSQLQKTGWDVLEVKIKRWVTAVRTAVKTLFHGERILCDYVFSSSDNIRESCFAEISRDKAMMLFSFPENVAKIKKILSPEKTFRFLDMYEAISELWIDVEIIFCFDSLSAVKSQTATSLMKLGEAVRVMLSQFESAIEKDSSKVAIPGGGVHPLTRYVMNYLVFLTDYSGAVADIVTHSASPVQMTLPASYFSSPINGGNDGSPISDRLAWIILMLLCKLDGKARLYKDHVALSYLFLANNLNYIVSKVKTSNLLLLMGSDWISNHQSKVKQYAANYERIGWAKALTSLPENPTAVITLPEMAESLINFNSGFEEAYRTQSSWVIPDSKLRDDVKVSLFRKMVPVYRVIYEKHRKANGKRSIVRYAPQDLENYLSDLFYGNSVSGGGLGSSRATSYEFSSFSSSSSSPSHSRGH